MVDVTAALVASVELKMRDGLGVVAGPAKLKSAVAGPERLDDDARQRRVTNRVVTALAADRDAIIELELGSERIAYVYRVDAFAGGPKRV